MMVMRQRSMCACAGGQHSRMPTDIKFVLHRWGVHERARMLIIAPFDLVGESGPAFFTLLVRSTVTSPLRNLGATRVEHHAAV